MAGVEMRFWVKLILQYNAHSHADMSCFDADPNFCPECGTILPLPGTEDIVRCPGCSFCIPVAGTESQGTSDLQPQSTVRTAGPDFCLIL